MIIPLKEQSNQEEINALNLIFETSWVIKLPDYITIFSLYKNTDFFFGIKQFKSNLLVFCSFNKYL